MNEHTCWLGHLSDPQREADNTFCGDAISKPWLLGANVIQGAV